MIRRRIDQYNPAHRARRNVAHHYDLNGRLYSLFLDRDRQYSCAYFPHGDETLEEAQIAKKRHIAAKLRLDRPGLSVLDIGSGWGGLALTLARDHGAHVLGITLVHRAARRGACTRHSRGAGRSRLLRTARLSHAGPRLRPHRLGRHVRARRRRTLPRILRYRGALPQPGRRGAAARDRPQRRAEFHQPVDRQIHLPRRLLSRIVRGAAGGGEERSDRHRHRGATAALRRDAAPLAAPVRRESRHHCLAVRRTLLPDVRILPVRRRDRLPAGTPHGVPDPAHPPADRGAADARLHHRATNGVPRTQRSPCSTLIHKPNSSPSELAAAYAAPGREHHRFAPARSVAAPAALQRAGGAGAARRAARQQPRL